MRHARPVLKALSFAMAAAIPLQAAHAAPGHGRKWLSYDAGANTVTFKLVAGEPGKKTRLNFNGRAHGKATLVVPGKSTVIMNFVNQDSLPHSAAVVDDKDPMPSVIKDPAIPHASTKDLATGLPRAGTDVMRFTAPASGNFRIVSGVPGQAASGMWIRLKVDPTAKQPSWLKSNRESKSE